MHVCLRTRAIHSAVAVGSDTKRPVVMAVPTRKLRILSLHSFRTSAAIFQEQVSIYTPPLLHAEHHVTHILHLACGRLFDWPARQFARHYFTWSPKYYLMNQSGKDAQANIFMQLDDGRWLYVLPQFARSGLDRQLEDLVELVRPLVV